MKIKALVVIDVQNDFLPGGALVVPHGDEILPIVNTLLDLPFNLIIATKDWHTKDHLSFAANHKKSPGEKIMLGQIEQILWSSHCVQNTKGAEFPLSLHASKIAKIFYKGIDKTIDSYSAFFDNAHLISTGLADFLIKHNATEIYIAGLATDYCVKYSVLDGLKLGFKIFVVTDACRGINIDDKDSFLAFKEMRTAGATLVTSNEVVNEFKDVFHLENNV